MPATTSALMALRLSGRLMVIQNACPRFSRITLFVSVIVSLTRLPLLCKYLRQDGGGLQAGIRGAVPVSTETRRRRSEKLGPGRRSSGFHACESQPYRAARKPNVLKFSVPTGVNV